MAKWWMLIYVVTYFATQSARAFHSSPCRIPRRSFILLGSRSNSRAVRQNRRHTSHSRPNTRHDAPTKLESVSSLLTSASTRAATSMGLAVLVGRRAPSDTRILATLGTAAIFSNALSWAPLTSPLYDAAWRYCLPGSLVLLLLSLSTTTPTETATTRNTNTNTPQSPIGAMTAIRQMALPFVWASLSSILGCFVALGLSAQCGILTDQAPLALSCLVASFVGGSVNFAATAQILSTLYSGSGGNTAALLSAMAAADLIVMALYFAILGTAVNWTRLKEWVQLSHDDSPIEPVASDKIVVQATMPTKDDVNVIQSTEHSSRIPVSQYLTGSLMTLGITGILVELAHTFEDCFARIVPGTACGVLALLTPLLRRFIPTKTLVTTPFWSEVAFLSLFATVGLTANVASAVKAGPGCLVLSTVALLVHVVAVLLGTAIWNRTKLASNTISLETALIASNAAIGGPATAAAWAPHRALAATVWGVVGYATGTTIGIAFYKCLATTSGPLFFD